MKNLRLIFLLVLLVISSYLGFSTYQDIYYPKIKDTAFTREQVGDVYLKLLLASGHNDLPPLYLLKNNIIINAWTDGQSIVITTGMLKILHNEHELALVLGHELAHYIAHDVYHSKDMIGANMEANADKLGAFIMMRAGFNICEGRKIMKTFKQLFGDFAAPLDHPSNAYRYDQLTLPSCSK